MTTQLIADNGSISGSNGLKMVPDASGVMQFQTGTGVTAMTIDGSQNVGIGISPIYKLDVTDNTTGTQLRLNSSSGNGCSMSFVSTSTNGRTYRIGSNYAIGNGEFTIYDANSASSRLTITSAGYVGIGTTNPGSLGGTTLEVAHTGSDGIQATRMGKFIGLNANYSDANVHSRITTTNPNISFATNGDNSRAWVTPYGIALGSSVSGSSGTGIAFPATQNPSSDANTLDDYEEGTWTPVITGGTSNPTYTATAAGDYTKIGRTVFLRFDITVSSISGGSGQFQISGVPFLAAGYPGWSNGIMRDCGGLRLNAQTNNPSFWTGSDSTILFMQTMRGTSDYGSTNIQISEINTGRLTGTITFNV